MITSSEAPVLVKHSVDRVNLYDFGYEKSGNVKGDTEVYRSFLSQIKNGDLVEPDYQGFTAEEKKERIKEIKSLEKEAKSLEKENAVIEEEIKEKEQEIEKYRKDLLNIKKVSSKDKDHLKENTFSVFKFSLNLLILVVLSVYLFFFYVSATYKALYVDFEGIAESISQGAGTGSIMPGAYELMEAMSFNVMLVLVPFVFYAFGWAFHVLLEMKSKLKFLFLSLLVAVTFTVDFLLALIIHNNTEMAKELMGLNSTPWSQSSGFYIILFLGFLVYVIWSVLLDSLLREWDKKHVANNIKRIMKHIQEDIEILRGKLADVKSVYQKIEDYREDVATISKGNLKKYIDQFHSGWISYLAPENMKEAREACISAKSDFEDKHGIQKGIIKVISKR